VAKATRTLARGEGLLDRFAEPAGPAGRPESWARSAFGAILLLAVLALSGWVVLGGGCRTWRDDPAQRALCTTRVIVQVAQSAGAREWARLGLGLCRDWNGRP